MTLQRDEICSIEIASVAGSYFKKIIEDSASPSAATFRKVLDAEFYKHVYGFVHKNVDLKLTTASFGSGLPGSPVIWNEERTVAISSGASNVAEIFSARISRALRRSYGAVMQIPHGFARPEDVLKFERFRKQNVAVCEGEVMYVFSGADGSSEQIRAALGKMMPNISIGWILSRSLDGYKPILAIVQSFDGDGWVAIGPDSCLMNGLLERLEMAIGPVH